MTDDLILSLLGWLENEEWAQEIQKARDDGNIPKEIDLWDLVIELEKKFGTKMRNNIHKKLGDKIPCV